MRKLLPLLLGFGLFFIACKKDIEQVKTRISGSVVDFYTNEKVPNVELNIFEKDYYIWFYPQFKYYSTNYGYHKSIGSVKTDANGCFALNIGGLNEFKEYNISLFNDISITDSLYRVIPNTVNNFEIKVKKYSTLQLNLKNTKPIPFSLSITSESKFGIWYLFGESFTDSLLNIKVIPDTKCKVLWDYYLEYPFIRDSIIFDVYNTDTIKVDLTI